MLIKNEINCKRIKVIILGIKKSISLFLFIILNPIKNRQKNIIKIKLTMKNVIYRHFILLKSLLFFSV